MQRDMKVGVTHVRWNRTKLKGMEPAKKVYRIKGEETQRRRKWCCMNEDWVYIIDNTNGDGLMMWGVWMRIELQSKYMKKWIERKGTMEIIGWGWWDPEKERGTKAIYEAVCAHDRNKNGSQWEKKLWRHTGSWWGKLILLIFSLPYSWLWYIWLSTTYLYLS